MKISLWPRNKLGKWSAGLSVAFTVFILLKMMGLMPIPTFTIAALGVAGFIAGIAAIIINKEKSILVFLSIPVGLIIILWTAAEFIYPH